SMRELSSYSSYIHPPIPLFLFLKGKAENPSSQTVINNILQEKDRSTLVSTKHPYPYQVAMSNPSVKESSYGYHMECGIPQDALYPLLKISNDDDMGERESLVDLSHR
ncbi:hypothetical protein STEG23_010708, partial [Scotinomys teguina]